MHICGLLCGAGLHANKPKALSHPHQINANFHKEERECCLVACRIGGASALFSQGVSPEFVKALGRWWSGAYLLYIRQMQGNAQKLMVQACSAPCEYVEQTPDDQHPDDFE